MNSIITLPKLTELLAEAASVDLKTAQSFISDLTSMISEALKADGTVNIRGLGSFNKVVSDNKIKVEFIADKEISDSINAPFLFFEPVQLADGIPSESIEEIGTEINSASDVDPSQIETALEPVDQNVEVTQNAEDAPSEVSEESATPEESEIVVMTETPEEDTAEKEEISDIPDSSEEQTLAEDSVESLEETMTEEIENDEITAESSVETTEVDGDSTQNSGEKDTFKVNVDSKDVAKSPQKEEPESSVIPPTDDAEYDSIDDEEEETMKLPWFTISLFFVVGLMVGLGLGYFGHDYIRGRATSNSIIPSEPELEVVPLDTVAQDDTTFVDLSDATEDVIDKLPDVTENKENQDLKNKEEATITETSQKTVETPVTEKIIDKKPEPVYDVITPGSDLISLSVKHYKNKEYWVYIYEANKSKIKNPNNVMSGLRLVIPPKSQCDVSTDETKNIEAAKAKSAQILRQFKK